MIIDEEVGWTVTECARRLGVARNTLSRLLHGRIGISPKMALALERAGWSSADHWMRIQAAWDLARARRELDAAWDVRLSVAVSPKYSEVERARPVVRSFHQVVELFQAGVPGVP